MTMRGKVCGLATSCYSGIVFYHMWWPWLLCLCTSHFALFCQVTAICCNNANSLQYMVDLAYQSYVAFASDNQLATSMKAHYSQNFDLPIL